LNNPIWYLKSGRVATAYAIKLPGTLEMESIFLRHYIQRVSLNEFLLLNMASLESFRIRLKLDRTDGL
jgi:hypothetical protein